MRKADARKRVHKMQPMRRMKVENRGLRAGVPTRMSKQSQIAEVRSGKFEGEMEAPRTPVGQCAGSLVMASEGLKKEEEVEPMLWSRRPDRVEGLGMAEEDERAVGPRAAIAARTSVVDETAGRSKMELSRYDQAAVGLLLKQLRLHGGAGRRR